VILGFFNSSLAPKYLLSVTTQEGESTLWEGARIDSHKRNWTLPSSLDLRRACLLRFKTRARIWRIFQKWGGVEAMPISLETQIIWDPCLQEINLAAMILRVSKGRTTKCLCKFCTITWRKLKEELNKRKNTTKSMLQVVLQTRAGWVPLTKQPVKARGDLQNYPIEFIPLWRERSR